MESLLNSQSHHLFQVEVQPCRPIEQIALRRQVLDLPTKGLLVSQHDQEKHLLDQDPPPRQARSRGTPQLGRCLLLLPHPLNNSSILLLLQPIPAFPQMFYHLQSQRPTQLSPLPTPRLRTLKPLLRLAFLRYLSPAAPRQAALLLPPPPPLHGAAPALPQVVRTHSFVDRFSYTALHKCLIAAV